MSARVLAFTAVAGRRRARRPAEVESVAEPKSPRDCVREFPCVSDAIQLCAFDRMGVARMTLIMPLFGPVEDVASWMLTEVRRWDR
jgi:hypothetical protein